MHQDESAELRGPSIAAQFGDIMKARREEKDWSQRQLAQALHTVGLRLDPSAITRIERGSREVKLAEAIAIASVLEFHLAEISFSPEEQFQVREWSEVQLAIQARKALLDALRHFDRWANNTDDETEQRLISKRGLNSISDLYTDRLRKAPAFKRGGRLGMFPGDGDGDNYTVSVSEFEHKIKQETLDLITSHILLTDDEFQELLDEFRSRLGRGLADLIPTEPGTSPLREHGNSANGSDA